MIVLASFPRRGVANGSFSWLKEAKNSGNFDLKNPPLSLKQFFFNYPSSRENSESFIKTLDFFIF